MDSLISPGPFSLGEAPVTGLARVDAVAADPDVADRWVEGLVGPGQPPDQCGPDD